MEKQLLEEINKNLFNYKKKILDSIEREIYQCKRYNINFSIALDASITKLEMRDFDQILRKTDNFIVLSEYINCSVFTFTDESAGIKAASNMLSRFEMCYFSEKIYISVINAEDCESPEQMVIKLFDVLIFGIRHGMNNIPLSNTSF